MKVAVYPGSFDPITNGHLDILSRASSLFGKVVLLVSYNPGKKYIFTSEERVEMVKQAIEGKYSNVVVDFYDGLTMDYAKKINACCIVRGLRAVSDFEYEFQLAAANEYVASEIDSIFFMTHNEVSFISSSFINELKQNHVDISQLVPESVNKMYKKKFNL